MADEWYFTRGGSPQGPVTALQLKRLAATGALAPTDLVWPEGGDPLGAVEAQALLPAEDFQREADSSGNWLGKVAKTLATSTPASGIMPDWLSDVEQEPTGPLLSEALTPPVLPATSKGINKRRSKAQVGEASPPIAEPVYERQNVVSNVLYPPRLILSGASSRGPAGEPGESRFQTWLWNGNDSTRNHEIALVVVADGKGNYQGGEEASKLTVQTVAQHLSPIRLSAQQESSVLAAVIDQTFHEANRVIRDKAREDPRWNGMYATAAVVVIWNGHAHFGHVGNCQVYLHRGQEWKQLTKAQNQRESTTEVIQTLGSGPTIKPLRGTHEFVRGDTLVVSANNLAYHLALPAIKQSLNSPPCPAQHMALQLVNLAEESSGKESCTLVVAHFG
jgi:PPM family protein phosphatase